MPDTTPTVSTLTGQLTYIFEEERSLRAAPVEQLAARLNYEDRLARAIAAYPLEDDAGIQAHLDEFGDRIGLSAVEEARRRALAHLDDD